MVNCDEGDADDDIGVQHVTNTTTAYILLASSFYANTWKNMVDPSCFQIPFVCTWEEGMNFSKGLTFANKEAVKHALIIQTKSKLCATCIDQSCKWYVGAFMKPKLNGLWMVTYYVGPYSCTPFDLRRDGRMMDSNFNALEIVPKLRQDHSARIDQL